MHTTSTHETSVRTRRRRFATALAASVVIAGGAGTVAAQPADPPPWSVCEHRGHPVAADLGPLLPVNYEPPPEVVAVLLGQVGVGTDCSIYDLPV